MESLIPYVLGWLVPTILAAVAGYLKGKLSKAKADAEESRRTLDAVAVMVCRMCIYDEHFSVDEKVDAYALYRAKGGNHQAKKHMDELLGEDADAWLARHEK